MGTRLKYPEERRVARLLLAQGDCGPNEIARLAGVSPQLAHQWATNIRWRDIRMQRLRAQWRREIKRGTEITKR